MGGCAARRAGPNRSCHIPPPVPYDDAIDPTDVGFSAGTEQEAVRHIGEVIDV
jgi:hypothetical protein